MTLAPPIAAGFARLTLEHVGREYPYKRDQVLTGPEDVTLPSTLHPIFHGSFDWQSCVHGWWQLLTIARLFPDLPEAAEIRARADEMLRVEKVAGEVAYLDRPGTAGFERPYGWAWALALHSEAARHEAGWGAALEPLARVCVTFSAVPAQADLAGTDGRSWQHRLRAGARGGELGPGARGVCADERSDGSAPACRPAAPRRQLHGCALARDLCAIGADPIRQS